MMKAGMPQVSTTASRYSVRRLVYEWAHGPIPAGQLVAPACTTPDCVHPWHCELQTRPVRPTLPVRPAFRPEAFIRALPSGRWRVEAPAGAAPAFVTAENGVLLCQCSKAASDDQPCLHIMLILIEAGQAAPIIRPGPYRGRQPARQIAPGTWEVPSAFEGGDLFVVRSTDTGYECTCPSPRRRCVHIEAVFTDLARPD